MKPAPPVTNIFSTRIGYPDRVRGVLLAGGLGTRLSPITKVINKHLVPIYDKPMIYYPLSTLILSGATEICIVSTSDGINQFRKLLGTGSQWGLKLFYAVQDSPDGIADGIKIANKAFSSSDSLLVILGDNVFYGQGLGRHISEIIGGQECVIWTQEVSNPENFGIASLDAEGNIESIVEKPKNLNGNLAITGLYYFPENISTIALSTIKSARGEHEITDILNAYLELKKIKHKKLSRGVYWIDSGTIENLLEATQFVSVVQTRQGQLIGAPDEAAWRMNLISELDFNNLLNDMPESTYREQLLKIL